MGKLLKILFSRVLLTGVIILLEVLLLVGTILWASQISSYIYWLFIFISIFFILYLFSVDQAVEYKLIWSLLIILVPVLGGLFYLLWGKRSTDWRALRSLHIVYENTNHLLSKGDEDANEMIAQDPSLTKIPDYLKSITGSGVYKDCKATYYPTGEDFFPAFLEDLEKAERFILMEYFIVSPGLMWDSILEILKRKVKEGVEVYFMYDDAGSVSRVPNKYHITLCDMGIKAVKFNHLRPQMYTLMNYRDHRKITVIDGKIGYTGGLNLADEYINVTHPYGYWKDTAVKVEGNSVWELTVMFFQMYCFESKEEIDIEQYRVFSNIVAEGYVQFYGDDPLDNVNVSEDTYLNIVARAKKYIYIYTPYLIIDSRMVGALQTAARCGVDVRIITPGVPDKKTIFYVTQSYYHALLDAGVKIYEFTPGFLHAKCLVSDDDIAMVGTVNMDYRSLYLHFECAAIFYKNNIPLDVKADMDETLLLCKRVTISEVNETGLVKRLVQAILRIFAPLM